MEPMTHFASARRDQNAKISSQHDEEREQPTRRTLKVLRIRHKRRATPRAPILLIHRIRPIPTQRNIQHNLVIKKVLLDTALIPILKNRRRLAPRLRTRLLVHNILRNRSTGEVPHLDRVLVPRVCVHAPSVDVEVVSVVPTPWMYMRLVSTHARKLAVASLLFLAVHHEEVDEDSLVQRLKVRLDCVF